jgi:hypothetical protein
LGPAAFYICWGIFSTELSDDPGPSLHRADFPVVTIIAVGLTAAIAKAIWVDRRYREEEKQPHSEPRRHRAF